MAARGTLGKCRSDKRDATPDSHIALLQLSKVRWLDYPYKIEPRVEVAALARMHDYLASLDDISIRRPDPSLWAEIPHCESRAEIDAAFKLGTIHFSGRLTVGNDRTRKDKLVFKLSPPSAGMGSALYRRFGSDRFFVRSR